MSGGLRIPEGTVPIVRSVAERHHESDEERAERLAQSTAHRLARWHRQVPHRFRDASAADLTVEQDHNRVVRDWWGRGSRAMVLSSTASGVGKTHAMYGVANDAVRQHRVWAAAWFMPDLNKAMRPGGDEAAFDIATQCELLCIDDLGKEVLSEWTLERLTMILDARSRASDDDPDAPMRRLIVTTNLSGPGMVERYGDPVVSRIVDDMKHLKVEGPPRRTPAPW